MSDGSPDIMLIRQDIKHLDGKVTDGFAAVNKRLDKMNGNIAANTEGVSGLNLRMTVREQFCDEQVKPMLKVIGENRQNIAVMVAKWSAVGLGGGGIIYAIIEGIKAAAGG